LFDFTSYSLDEILTLLEEGDVRLLPDNEIDIYIQPPVNANDDVTDEDSGEEDNPTVNNLPGNQLLAPAELGQFCEEHDEVCSSSNESHADVSTENKPSISEPNIVSDNEESSARPAKKAKLSSKKENSQNKTTAPKKTKNKKISYN